MIVLTCLPRPYLPKVIFVFGLIFKKILTKWFIIAHTDLSPFFLRLVSVAQQVTDAVCSDDLKHEAEEEDTSCHCTHTPLVKCSSWKEKAAWRHDTRWNSITRSNTTHTSLWNEQFAFPGSSHGVKGCSYSRRGFRADPRSPLYTASSQTPPPRKCPRGSAHLYEGGKAAYRASGPAKDMDIHLSCDQDVH